MLCCSVPINTGGQRALSFFGSSAGPVKDEVYAFGGFFYDGKTYNDKDQIDVHVFNTVKLRWTPLPTVGSGSEECCPDVPSMHYGHTAVLITEYVIYIWGGVVNCKTTCVSETPECRWIQTTGDRENILYAFEVDTHRWFKPKVSGAVPEARYSHSACVLGKAMFIHGGYTQAGRTNDTYKLDTSTMTWSLMNMGGIPPPGSTDHSATMIGSKMYICGGFGHQDIIRVFDTESSCWLSTPPDSAGLLPEQRYCHAAFAYNEELYIFGGNKWDPQGTFNDLWKFNPKTLSWKKLEPKDKDPRLSGDAHCCMVGDDIVLFNRLFDSQILFLKPSLKTLCKLAVIQYRLERSGLPHNIRRELEAMKTRISKGFFPWPATLAGLFCVFIFGGVLYKTKK